MSDSILQVEKIKPKDGSGTGAITIADSNSNVTIGNLAGGAIGSAVSGVMNLITNTSVTGSDTSDWDVDNIFSSTYENYMVILNLLISSDGANVQMGLLDDSGNLLSGTKYHYTHAGWRSVNGNIEYATEGNTNWHLGRVVGSNTGEALNSTIFFSGIGVSQRCISFRSLTSYRPTTEEVTRISGGGQYGAGGGSDNNQAVRGLRFDCSAGNVKVASKISVYGIR